MHGDWGTADEGRALLAAEPLKCRALATAAFACLSGLLLGYDVGITNGLLQPVRNHFEMSEFGSEMFVGCLNIFSLPGCWLGGVLAERAGRRGAIASGALLFLVGNVLMTAALGYAMLAIGRAVVGVAVGVTVVTEPMFTAETSPARLRGMLGTNVEVSFNLGILFGFVASWALGGLPDETSWRWMIGLSLPAPLVSLAAVGFVLPESPRWLASRGRWPEVEATLNQLVGPKEAQQALESLRAVSKAQAMGTAESDMTWTEMCSAPNIRWLMLLGGGVAFFAQATGIDGIMYYSNVILDNAGLSRDQMLGATVIMGCFKQAAIVVHGCIVDHVGRRPLLILSSLGMGLCMLTLGWAYSASAPLFAKVVPITGFVVFFSLGYGPIVYILNSELYPNCCRSKGLVVAMIVNRGTSAVIATVFLSLVSRLGFGGAFLLLAAVALAAALFVAVLVPETSGRRLEDDSLVVPEST